MRKCKWCRGPVPPEEEHEVTSLRLRLGYCSQRCVDLYREDRRKFNERIKERRRHPVLES